MGKIIEDNFMYGGKVSVAKIVTTVFLVPAIFLSISLCGFGFVLALLTMKASEGNSSEIDISIAMIAAFMTGTMIQLSLVVYLTS